MKPSEETTKETHTETANKTGMHQITEELMLHAEGYQKQGMNAATIAAGYLGAAVLVAEMLGCDPENHLSTYLMFQGMAKKAIADETADEGEAAP